MQAVIPPNPNRHVPVVLMSNTLASAVAAESDIHIFSHAAEGERNIQDLCDQGTIHLKLFPWLNTKKTRFLCTKKFILYGIKKKNRN